MVQMFSCNLRNRFAIALSILAVVSIGCAKAAVTARQTYAESEQAPKPARIIVYDFAATPEDIPEDDPMSGFYAKSEKPPTADKVSLGRNLSAKVALELVKEIRDLGMPAERSSGRPSPDPGDVVIKGAFVTIDPGDRLKRMLIGFGAGAGELKTFVEIYQMTADGLRPLVSEEIKATGGKMPGMLFAVAAAVATGPAGVSVGAAAASGPAGAASQATVVSGGVNVAKEIGPESLRAATKGTAKEIAKALSQIFERHGWIGTGNRVDE